MILIIVSLTDSEQIEKGFFYRGEPIKLCISLHAASHLADKEGSQAVFRVFHAVSCPLCVNRDPPILSRTSPPDV